MKRDPTNARSHPPILPRLLVELFFRAERREVVLGDLDEGFVEVLARGGRPGEAKRWYWWNAIGSIGALLKDRIATWTARARQAVKEASFPFQRVPSNRPKGDQAMSKLWYETRFAVRALLRRPGFSLVAALTIALGVGANAAIFSVVNGVVLKPLPFHDPESLIGVSMIRWDQPDRGTDYMSPPDIADLLAQSPALATLVGYGHFAATLTGTGEPALVEAARLSDGLMETFRIAPALGRDIRAEECGPGGPRIVVISHRLWQDRFGMATDVLGKAVEVNGGPYEIVGVAPEGFEFPAGTQLWMPHRINPESCGRACHTFRAVGRLTPGATVASGQAEADTIATSLADAYPESNTEKGFRVDSLQHVFVGDVRTPLWILLAAVTTVLFIAGANVANLLLIRASARTGEIAVRAALGASRSRLAFQVVMESAILALVGGLLGLLLASGGVELLRLTSAGTLPRVNDVAVDGTVVAFTSGLILFVTLLFGSSPAVFFARVPLSLNLNQTVRGFRYGLKRRCRSFLVGLEVALSVALLVGAGLLLRSFEKLYAVDLGFETRGVVRFTLSLPSLRYGELEELRTFCRTLEDRIATLPGVESVGSIYGAPLGEAHTTSVVLVEGRPEPPPGRETFAAIRAVSPHYLQTLHIPLVRGRTLESADDSASVSVGVVNQAFVRENFPSENPFGKKVRIKTDMGYGSPYWTIVGIVGDIRSHALVQSPVPEIYVPHGLFGPGYVTVNARSGLDVETLLPAIRSEVRALDPNLPLQSVETVAEVVQQEVSPTRFYLLMMGLFAVLALILAAVGLYGVLGYLVSQRTREIGIRVAMGAGKTEIVRMVVSEGLRPTLIGIAAGLALSFSAGRILESLLYEVTPWDPWTLASVSLVVLATALVSTLTPAKRACQVDPVTVLREE